MKIMFLEYMRLTVIKKNIFSFVKLNISAFVLEVLALFILPLLIRQYYIVGYYEALAINLSFLFLFEVAMVFISKHSLNIFSEGKKNVDKHLFEKALFFAFIKTVFFGVFLYLFKKAINLSSYLAFLLCFLSIFFFLCMFYLPCLLLKNSFTSSLKKSINLYVSYPFFTAFVFLHSVILFFISIILLNLYPGPSKIMYNVHVALHIIEKKFNL